LSGCERLLRRENRHGGPEVSDHALSGSYRLNELRDVFFLAEDMRRRVKAEVGFSIAT